MAKKKRSLENRGMYNVPVDNVYVVRPDTVDREVPNLIYGINNRNFFNVGVGYNRYGKLVDYNTSEIGDTVTMEEARNRIKNSYVPRRKVAIEEALRDITLDKYRTNKKYKDGGSIYIAPSKRGTFTAAAKRHHLGVQQFASRVLANKDNYSSAMVKKANFARNASKWH